MKQIDEELAESVVWRWSEGDARSDAMLALTRTPRRLAWALLVVELATRVLAAVTLVVAPAGG
jgi:hypothetical protein